jgi:hypothetical protein
MMYSRGREGFTPNRYSVIRTKTNAVPDRPYSPQHLICRVEVLLGEKNVMASHHLGGSTLWAANPRQSAASATVGTSPIYASPSSPTPYCVGQTLRLEGRKDAGVNQPPLPPALGLPNRMHGLRRKFQKVDPV